jgi:CheY-like chemotaxis protein
VPALFDDHRFPASTFQSNMKNGPILLIEDDEDDAILFKDIISELHLPNKLVWFSDSTNALEHLQKASEQPFIIFCDVNMPKCNGIDLKRQIDSNSELRKKSIPFTFYSTAASQKVVNEAFTRLTVQGFFLKKSTYGEAKSMLQTIIAYWSLSKHPNSFA